MYYSIESSSMLQYFYGVFLLRSEDGSSLSL